MPVIPLPSVAVAVIVTVPAATPVRVLPLRVARFAPLEIEKMTVCTAVVGKTVAAKSMLLPTKIGLRLLIVIPVTGVVTVISWVAVRVPFALEAATWMMAVPAAVALKVLAVMVAPVAFASVIVQVKVGVVGAGVISAVKMRFDPTATVLALVISTLLLPPPALVELPQFVRLRARIERIDKANNLPNLFEFFIIVSKF